jgi:hypothetical protein
MYYDEKMIDGVLHCRYTPDGEWRPVAQPVAWCRSSDFNDAQTKRQSFSGWREHHDDCDIALYAAPVAMPATPHATPAAMTDQHHRRAESADWDLVASEAADYSATHLCLLELRDRIAALEAAQANQFRGVTEKAASAEAQPTGGLVERVRRVIGDDAPCSHSNARAAIRKMAAAARSRDLNGQSVAVMTWEGVAQWLEQEANQ